MPNDNEMITLIKNAAQEGQFDKMSLEEMEKIYNYGSTLFYNRPDDEELSKAVNKFQIEIQKRKLNTNRTTIKASKTKFQKGLILTIPRGVKVTAILLIVVSGLQIVGPFLIMIKMMSKHGLSPSLIIPIMIMSFILPTMGLVSGVGLMSLKPWSLNIVLLFSKISIVYYGIGVVLGTALGNSSRGSDVFFVVAYGCTLPLWSLYYFSQPHIKILFAPK